MASPRAEHFLEALTPSDETKAEFMGEFTMKLPEFGEDGEEVMRDLNIPWVVIKDIMGAIRGRAERRAAE